MHSLGDMAPMGTNSQHRSSSRTNHNSLPAKLLQLPVQHLQISQSILRGIVLTLSLGAQVPGVSAPHRDTVHQDSASPAQISMVLQSHQVWLQPSTQAWWQ